MGGKTDTQFRSMRLVERHQERERQDTFMSQKPESLLKMRLIDVEGLAEYVGLSTHTIYTMVSQRRIPYVKVGRLVRFDLGLLDAWLKQHTVMPTPPRRACNLLQQIDREETSCKQGAGQCEPPVPSVVIVGPIIERSAPMASVHGTMPPPALYRVHHTVAESIAGGRALRGLPRG